MKQKGGKLERQICKDLSLWWTNGRRDDIFWRSAGSGGRATRRGTRTAGAHGDVTALDPSGEPLTDLFNIEIKNGYSSNTIQDCVDALEHAAKQQYTKWFEQAQRDCDLGGQLTWMLIVKRDKRAPLVWFDTTFAQPMFKHSWSMRMRSDDWDVTGLTLESFFNHDPDMIVEMLT